MFASCDAVPHCAVTVVTHDLLTLEPVRRPLRASLEREQGPAVPWVAILLAASVAATGLVTGAYWHEIPQSLGHRLSTGWPALEDGKWWTLASSFVLTRDWFMVTTMPVCLVVVLGLYERRAGHTRTLLVAFVGHAVGTVLLSLAFAPFTLTHVPILVKAGNNLDYGGSMAIAAGFGALASRLHDATIRKLVVAITLIALAAHHQMADWGHFVAVPLGYAVDKVNLARSRTAA
jgi:phosphatidylglycerol lysyltransferase